ncbi:MAG: zinc-ribbon domain-containing transport protein [Candidatus Eremiobacteraeota bacterium]|nr:zinc-ribbon domain-containing transport protein [Candidatus Eremiobacteraeota bacterium]MBV8222092.1 zinc-ribbon domain-containing transport protein [Candidatus Eremiobacteraeota bacterium]
MGLINFLGWLLGGNSRGSVSTTFRMWTSDDPDMSGGMFDDATAAVAGAQAAPAAKPMWQQARDQIASLQQIDPDFSEVAFLDQASKIYLAALQAENNMNPLALGDRATKNYVDEMTARVTTWQNAGWKRLVKDVTIDSPVIFKVAVDGTQQLITVRFSGQSVRYLADATTGAVKDGSMQPAYFTEFGIFARPAGTTTPKAIGAGTAPHCPSCGAPLDPGTAICPYCRTPLTGTGSLWQLDRISASPYT